MTAVLKSTPRVFASNAEQATTKSTISATNANQTVHPAQTQQTVSIARLVSTGNSTIWVYVLHAPVDVRHVRSLEFVNPA